MGLLDYFAKGIEVQLFYALAIVLVLYSIPDDQKNYIVQFNTPETNVDINSVGSEFQKSFRSTTSFGFVDIAAMALFSGNIVIDLIMNFFLAVPSMVTLLLKAIFMIFNVESFIQNTIISYVFLFIAVVYVIALL